MYIKHISSRQNATVQHLCALLSQSKARKKHQQTVLEGIHLCQVALHKQAAIRACFVSEASLEQDEIMALLQHPHAADFPIYTLPNAVMHAVSELDSPSSIMMIIALQDTPTPSYQCNTLVLDQLQDAGNVGTLIRTASAAGFQQIVCSEGTAHCYSPKVLRAGMGAHFNLSIIEHVELTDFIQQFKGTCFATSSHASHTLYACTFNTPFAIVLGNEGAGVTPTLLEDCTTLCIPQPGGEESLNVATAGAIIMYEAVRQQLSHR